MSNEQYWEQRDKDKDKSLKKKEDKAIKEIQESIKKHLKKLKQNYMTSMINMPKIIIYQWQRLKGS